MAWVAWVAVSDVAVLEAVALEAVALEAVVTGVAMAVTVALVAGPEVTTVVTGVEGIISIPFSKKDFRYQRVIF